MHKHIILYIVSTLCCLNTAFAKTVTVKLTGTIHENVEMTLEGTGRTMVITTLPYTFKLTTDECPMRLSFTSDNYDYVSIDIPKRPADDIGHVYLLKSKEKQLQINNQLENNGSSGTRDFLNYQSLLNLITSSNKDLSTSKEVTNDESKIRSLDMTKKINIAPSTGKKKTNTFALIIANEEYEMASNVEMATFDGLAMKEYFSKTYGLTDNQILYYPNATFGKINKAMNDLKNIAEAYDGKINLVLYYAGHGIPDNATKDAYIMPVDVDGTDPSVCYSLKKLYSEIDAMHLNQAVVLLDACFSGAKRDGNMIVAARGVAIKPNEEKPKGNTIVISATSGEETAFSYKEEQHGMFTYFLLKYIQENNGKVTIGGLSDYITENVRKQSVLINGKKQTPTISIPSELENWQDIDLGGKY